MLKAKDIPQRVRADYAGGVHFPWKSIEKALGPDGHLSDYQGNIPDICPDFQRGHVWNDAQRIAWLEYKLSGGHGSDLILWNEYPDGAHVLVDGLQRLTSVRMFMRDEIAIFAGQGGDPENEGWHKSEIDPRAIRRISGGGFLRFTINQLKTRADVLRWYIELNAGGTPHSDEEIERVRAMLSD